MNHINKFKEMIWGGITGALLFTGIYIVLIIATSYAGNLLPASGPSIQKFFGMDKWTFEGIYKVFIIVAGVGVVSGVLVGWRCPQMTQKIFTPAACLGVPALLVGWFLYGYSTHIETPRSMKLTNCTNGIIEFSFRVPKGRSYNFVLATPGVGMVLNPPYTFSGDIQIMGETNLPIDFPIGSELAQQCNWLERDGIPYSFALTGSRNTNCPSLDRLIHGAKDYHVKIVFSQPPPPSTSFWLHWLQAYKDKDD